MPIGIQEPSPVPDKLKGAVLVAASIVAAIRLRGEEIRPSPRLRSAVYDALTLVREVLREVKVVLEFVTD